MAIYQYVFYVVIWIIMLVRLSTSTYSDEEIAQMPSSTKLCHCSLSTNDRSFPIEIDLISLDPAMILPEGNQTTFIHCSEAFFRCRQACEKRVVEYLGGGSLYPIGNVTEVSVLCRETGEAFLRKYHEISTSIYLRNLVSTVSGVVQHIWLRYQATGCRQFGLRSFLGTICCKLVLDMDVGINDTLDSRICPIDSCT